MPKALTELTKPLRRLFPFERFLTCDAADSLPRPAECRLVGRHAPGHSAGWHPREKPSVSRGERRWGTTFIEGQSASPRRGKGSSMRLARCFSLHAWEWKVVVEANMRRHLNDGSTWAASLSLQSRVLSQLAPWLRCGARPHAPASPTSPRPATGTALLESGTCRRGGACAAPLVLSVE